MGNATQLVYRTSSRITDFTTRCARIRKLFLKWINSQIHIFKHLQDSEHCRALCLADRFYVLDHAPTGFQLKKKEAIHIQREQPSLNQQLRHLILSYPFNSHTFIQLPTLCTLINWTHETCFTNLKVLSFTSNRMNKIRTFLQLWGLFWGEKGLEGVVRESETVRKFKKEQKIRSLVKNNKRRNPTSIVVRCRGHLSVLEEFGEPRSWEYISRITDEKSGILRAL